MPQFGRQLGGRTNLRRNPGTLLRSFLTLASLALVVVLVSACSGLNDNGTHEDFVQTQAAGQSGDNGGHGGDEGESEGTPEPDGSATEETGGSEDLAAEGQNLALSNACLGCHSVDGGISAGPTWQGLYGAEITLDDGSTVTADDAYIAESIRDPGAKIHEGFQNIMPPTYADWTDDQVNAIIAYIQSLE